MTKEKHNIFHGQFMCNINPDGKKVLVPATPSSQVRYADFLDSLTHSQKIEMFMESNVDNGTVTQIAKIHVCIRELAKEMGYSFEDMKLEVKKMSGLCVEKTIGNDRFLVCKSFGDCSIDELGLAIQTIVELGDQINVNFR